MFLFLSLYSIPPIIYQTKNQFKFYQTSSDIKNK